jgi:hypothetical protein
MIPGIQFGLGVDKDGVYIRYVEIGQKKERRRKVESVVDFSTFMIERSEKAGVLVDDFIVMCSSSMDFPEEYTSDKNVIKLARELR